jgi:hypothetical protein
MVTAVTPSRIGAVFQIGAALNAGAVDDVGGPHEGRDVVGRRPQAQHDALDARGGVVVLQVGESARCAGGADSAEYSCAVLRARRAVRAAVPQWPRQPDRRAPRRAPYGEEPRGAPVNGAPPGGWQRRLWTDTSRCGVENRLCTSSGASSCEADCSIRIRTLFRPAAVPGRAGRACRRAVVLPVRG